MAKDTWPTKLFAVASLNLDAKNPRLGRESSTWSPREIIQHLFKHDKALDIAESIAIRGYFPNEPLLAIKEGTRLTVVEGNRRLAALKALREPALLEGTLESRVEKLARRIGDIQTIAKVPVTTAPNRRATDRQIAGRHGASPVLAWQAENRASFILEKLAEGYDNDELYDELGYTSADIEKARQTRAIADMARSIDLPEEVKAKLGNPRAKLFTTLERVFDSSVGREFLKVEPSADYGLRGNTTKKEFLRGFTKLVTEVALGKVSSRTLNTNENIRTYFETWDPDELPKSKRGSFLPSDVITGTPVGLADRQEPAPKPKRSKPETKTVLPKDFKVRYGNERLIDITSELRKLDREKFPNAGAVLLRVFFELAAVDYLKRTGELPGIIEKLEKRRGGQRLPFGTPTMRQLAPELVRIAKKHLAAPDATTVEKAVKYDRAAPFTISDLHGFVHSTDLPGARDIQQFWLRTEPLFRMMLEQEQES